MNVVLWIAQVLTALAFVGAGYTHGIRTEQMAAQRGGEWVLALPRPLLSFISISESLGGLGLILPALTGILPWLTPLAGWLLALMMVLAALFHLIRREYPNIGLNLGLFALAAFVAYGRTAIFPL